MKKIDIFVGGMATVSIFFIAIGIIFTIFASSGGVTLWIIDRIVSDDKQYMQEIGTDIETEEFQSMLLELSNLSDNLSYAHAIALVFLFLGLGSTIAFLILGRPEWKIIDKDEKHFYLLFNINSTAITIVFSVLFAISLIFISSATFIVATKEQTINLILAEIIINQENQSILSTILDKSLAKSYFQLLLNVFHGVYFSLVGFLLIIARYIQYLKKETSNVLTVALIFSGTWALVIWAMLFIITIGFNTASDIPIPELPKLDD